ncbi:Ig-like domain-containing protein [Acidocella aminolytica]|nr:Ig-like domain-containing protein [Acidocella aminolytica]
MLATIASMLLSSKAWPLPDHASIGLNKFDLAQQYLGLASGGNGQPQYVEVERAMAKKAIVDAEANGVRFLRVAITGYAPSFYSQRSDLSLWLSNPGKYWAAMDAMMDDLHSHNIQIVPVLMFNVNQFPAMTHETVGDLLGNPHSKSWFLLVRYVTEFIKRYRGKHLIFLYEMTNELNLLADIDNVKSCQERLSPAMCSVRSNFTSAQMMAFIQRFYGLIKSLDPSVPVSTGFSLPRPSAAHLRAHPGFLYGKPDWSHDSLSRSLQYLASINKYANVISVHIYPESSMGGIKATDPQKLIPVLEKEAKELGKPLFIGEFGAKNPESQAGQKFIKGMLAAITQNHVAYSALWVWEFYQKNTYSTYDTPPTRYNVGPGYTDGVIHSIKAANAKLDVMPDRLTSADAKPIVVIDYPLDCQRVTAPVPVYAVASIDGGAVTKVKFILDGHVVGFATKPPYHVEILPDMLNSGIHHLTAVAYDDTGVTGQYETAIVVGADYSNKCVVPTK